MSAISQKSLEGNHPDVRIAVIPTVQTFQITYRIRARTRKMCQLCAIAGKIECGAVATKFGFVVSGGHRISSRRLYTE